MSLALGDLFRSRLTLRIYLVGLAQMLVVAVGFVLMLHAFRPRGGLVDGELRHVARHVEAALGDPARPHRPVDPRAVERELDDAERDFRAPFAVVDATGAVVARSPGAELAGLDGRCPVVHDGETSDASVPRRCFAAPLRFPDGAPGQLVFAPRGPPPPPPFGTRIVPLVLVVVAISSLLLARSLTRPLGKLSAAARAFGGGDLAARVALARKDELGDVSRAFDEMAERVTELLRSEKELLANVSHELRTPLARIRVALDIASEGSVEVARESLVDIGGDLDELERLISDVLTAARLDLGDGSAKGIPPLRREPVDVRQLLELAASRFRSAHASRTLELDIPDELGVVDGDAVLLRRVVDNLLENAHKYSERPDDPVTLVARSDPSTVEIDVVDRGIGIASVDLPRVFRPFFRADKSRTRATGGLGLGLALAKRIVDAHGGTIALSSEPAKGTRARVRLPKADTC